MQDVYVIKTDIMALHLLIGQNSRAPYHHWKLYQKACSEWLWNNGYTPPFQAWVELTPEQSEDLRQNYLAAKV